MRWALVLLAACGSHHAAPRAIANTAADGGVAVSTTCGQGACKAGDGCSYAGGTCSCGVPSYCGGAAPEENRDPFGSELLPSWQCTPTTPAVRADGCPGPEPSDGAACSDEGKNCTYGDCCVSQAVCSGGKWAIGAPECPP